MCKADARSVIDRPSNLTRLCFNLLRGNELFKVPPVWNLPVQHAVAATRKKQDSPVPQVKPLDLTIATVKNFNKK
ncbi:uncharacterized protein RCC_08004 [Ramularia collo-cygni]|uniref:Uncharacterized protein n=1 Tax=Ramularia collo-cygni TaxID=112498 RepID=A0A2D3V606_9PEZI|nr:uncharacterized protein RCC_08004 [Ramularia collo-cygni]CZT22135.1 uncharacterized protein RCC_08004 [Ramularia collo-cygni]